MSDGTARQAKSPEVKDLRSESLALKECIAELPLENRLFKKARQAAGISRDENPASEKLEITRIIEGSHLPVKQTLDMSRVPHRPFLRWYDLYVDGGFDALADRAPRPRPVWNHISDARRYDLIEFAPEHEALSTRELAAKYTDEKQYVFRHHLLAAFSKLLI